MLVLDCSVLMAWVAPDEPSDYAENVRRFVAARNMAVAVPPLFFLEAVNVLAVMEKRGRMAASQTDKATEFLERLPIAVDAEGSSLAAVLRCRSHMQKHSLSAYDASYLELAVRRALPLATLDKKLRAAATAEKVFLGDERR